MGEFSSVGSTGEGVYCWVFTFNLAPVFSVSFVVFGPCHWVWWYLGSHVRGVDKARIMSQEQPRIMRTGPSAKTGLVMHTYVLGLFSVHLLEHPRLSDS